MEATKTHETGTSPNAGMERDSAQALDQKEAAKPAIQEGPSQSDASTTTSGSRSLKGRSRGTHPLSYFDAATALALTTAALFFWGYSYHSAYFATLRIPAGLLTLPFEAYIIAGWNYGWVIIFFVSFMLFLREFLGDPARWLVNKIGQEHTRTISRYMPAFAIGLALAIFLYVGDSAKQDGRRAAEAAFAKRKRVEFVPAEGITLPGPLYLLGYTGSKYVVYYKPDEKTEASVYLLGENEVRRPSFPGDGQSGTASPDQSGKQEASGKVD